MLALSWSWSYASCKRGFSIRFPSSRASGLRCGLSETAFPHASLWSVARDGPTLQSILPEAWAVHIVGRGTFFVDALVAAVVEHYFGLCDVDVPI